MLARRGNSIAAWAARSESRPQPGGSSERADVIRSSIARSARLRDRKLICPIPLLVAVVVAAVVVVVGVFGVDGSIKRAEVYSKC